LRNLAEEVVLARQRADGEEDESVSGEEKCRILPLTR
jgi:hypothetical protein